MNLHNFTGSFDGVTEGQLLTIKGCDTPRWFYHPIRWVVLSLLSLLPLCWNCWLQQFRIPIPHRFLYKPSPNNGTYRISEVISATEVRLDEDTCLTTTDGKSSRF